MRLSHPAGREMAEDRTGGASMADPTNSEIRVLLPTKPEDGLDDVSRVLKALLPAQRTHARRLFVYRPAEADFYLPDGYPRLPEISRLEKDAENATRIDTERIMEPLSSAGFIVSADVIRGTPTEEILHESSIWRSDLVAVRTRSLAAADERIGGMASALLYHGTCPVLTHHAVPENYRVRKILIPTDFSAASRASADWALALAALTGAEPILLHVIARRANRHGINPDELLEIATSEVVRWKERLQPIFPSLVNEARVLLADTPAEGILSFARERGCDLIVMATTGVSAVRAILLGSNARKVVRASSCPVLVIPASNRVTADAFLQAAKATTMAVPKPAARPSARRRAERRIDRVLVATDLSPASTAAIRKAIGIARANGASLLLAHAHQPPSLVLVGYVPPHAVAKWDEDLREDVRRRMQPYLDEAEKAGVKAEAVILSGSPKEAITEAAREYRADLVVVGTHGRTGVPRFFLGSVAARVVSSADCPVMTVRGE
jgi:nucleotide-binding universal stress UspA family protein